jgi:hypothetical protein
MVEDYNVQLNNGSQFAKDDYDNNTIYNYPRNKFKGFGEYENPILKDNEARINELVEMTKKEYPTIDNYLIWLMAVDYMMEELGIKEDKNIGKSLYEESLRERNKLIYDSVQLVQEV